MKLYFTDIYNIEEALKAPYFGRVDFREYKGSEEKIYIGKKGINVKLASRLTHYNLEIKTLEQVKEAGINILE